MSVEDLTDIPDTVLQPLTATEQQNLNADTSTSDTVLSNSEETRDVGGGDGDQITASAANSSDFTSDLGVGTIVITAPRLKKQVEISNPLHDYDSYTYCLSWHLLGINEFNRLIDNNNPTKVYVPQNVLVSSAGRWDNLLFKRNPSFQEDFYFENFKMKTIVNTTARNRNSNLIECDFTLIEPVGFTLINRLLEAAISINGSNGNYLYMPYVLQIDFFGYKDGILQPSPIRELTKVIPIKLVSLKSKITTRGTEYQVSAVPFNHQAFSQVHVTSPAAFSVSGSTVQSIFGQGKIDNSFRNQLSTRSNLEREQRLITEFLNQRSNDGSPGSADDYYNAQQALNAINSKLATVGQLSASGYCDAINAWFQDLTSQRTIKFPNIINVEFDPLIGNAKLFPTTGPINVAQATASGTSDRNKKTELQSASGSNKGSLTFNGTTMTIPAGTAIDKLIDWAVRNSDYIGSQISDPTQLKNVQNGQDIGLFKSSLKWYRIVPKIKIVDYDDTQNRYCLDITFFVKPYTLASKYPYAPKGRVPGYVKKYDYIYTGKNKDVIDLQIDFDMMYYVELSAYRASQKNTETAPGLGTNGALNPGLTTQLPTVVNDPYSKDPVNPSPVTTGLVAGNMSTTGRSGGNPQLAVAAGDLQRSLMLGARGDMITINMKIIGDPHLIKQDDIFYGQDLLPTENQLTVNQSLYMDGGELYVFVNFESPADYDETTGLADPVTSPYRVSEYSGIYKIITVDNTFSNGKFEQTLNLVKLLYDQEGNPLTSSITQRAESQATQLMGPLIPNNLVRFVGPRINIAGLSPATNTQAALAVASSTASGSGSGVVVNSFIQQGASMITSKITSAATSAISGAVTKGLDSLGKELSSIKFDIMGPNALGDLAAVDASEFGGLSELSEISGLDEFTDLGFEALDTDVIGDLGVEEFELGFEDLDVPDVDFGDFL
jgi:hypothetical protein